MSSACVHYMRRDLMSQCVPGSIKRHPEVTPKVQPGLFVHCRACPELKYNCVMAVIVLCEGSTCNVVLRCSL